jgi:hypothetical protein
MASQSAQDEFNALFNKGSYTTGKSHPEDSTSRSSTPRPSRSPSPAQSFLNLDDDDDDEDDAEDLAVKAMKGTYYVPRTSRQANTGPKGVIADAQAFEQAKRQAQSVRSVQQTRRSYSAGRVPVSEEVVSEEDEEDERFLESWRQKRLVELSQLRGAASALGRSGSKRRYGSLQRVDAEGFLNAVENAPVDAVVVVMIYDNAVSNRPSPPHSPCC